MSEPTTAPPCCAEAGCTAPGDPCYLPSEDAPTAHYCPAHAAANGFCWRCGQFGAGLETFEFLHPGTCDNCWSAREVGDG